MVYVVAKEIVHANDCYLHVNDFQALIELPDEANIYELLDEYVTEVHQKPPRSVQGVTWFDVSGDGFCDWLVANAKGRVLEPDADYRQIDLDDELEGSK